MEQEDECSETEPREMSVKCLSLDYDGTISPLNVSRIESWVPLETRVILAQIRRFLPIAIITMKDLPFVMPRTPFAHVWSGIGGLEMRIGKRTIKRDCWKDRLPNVFLALKYARSHMTGDGVEIEEKQDLEGHTVAFCVDWRHAENAKKAKREVALVATCCKALRLELNRYEGQPFLDVYTMPVNKGHAVRDALKELGLRNGALYIGDSEADNPAFRAADMSLGVIHCENRFQELDCDFFVKFEDVASFFNALLANGLVFNPELPMIKANRSMLKGC